LTFYCNEPSGRPKRIDRELTNAYELSLNVKLTAYKIENYVLTSPAMRSKTSFTNEFMIDIALDEIPVSGWT
jgi:hypothetical protein